MDLAIRSLLTVAMLVLLQLTTAAQEPNVENFKRFRARAIERLERSEGRRFNSNLLKVFGVPDDIRILTDAEIGLQGRRLTLTFSVNSADLFLTDSRKTPSGTVVTVFHTDLTLVLHAAASGVSVSDLQRIAKNDDAENQFREVLRRWDGVLPQMLERRELK